MGCTKSKKAGAGAQLPLEARGKSGQGRGSSAKDHLPSHTLPENPAAGVSGPSGATSEAIGDPRARLQAYVDSHPVVVFSKSTCERCAEVKKLFNSMHVPYLLLELDQAEYNNLSQQLDERNAKKCKCGSGRQPLFPELEYIICEWIADRRAKALVVRRADIQAFALAVAPQLEIFPEEFKASRHWLDGFLQRYELSLRSTTLFKLEDTEVIKRALAFKSFVDGTDFSTYQLSNIIAMDETAVLMGQGSQTTIDQRGASLIYIPSTGYESARYLYFGNSSGWKESPTSNHH
ncbi:hypothetical protein mRhiFer1_008018 [Rhinolophus ferrumequinum]|uniref:HTH CENPB-type domain-containing protein n=1 Tax=Rhinolophus ferrumequinum TaxID=59479 RepID=A0A7J7WQT0_RHIFE|nr:hypothetical protein mRhiFer1_008018 [Rhinolophus ferrumequinum]